MPGTENNNRSLIKLCSIEIKDILAVLVSTVIIGFSLSKKQKIILYNPVLLNRNQEYDILAVFVDVDTAMLCFPLPKRGDYVTQLCVIENNI